MNRTFWKEQILLSNCNLLFHDSSWKNCQSTMSKVDIVISWVKFLDFMLSTVPCPSFYVAASFQQTVVGFHHFLQHLPNCKAFHQCFQVFVLGGNCFWYASLCKHLPCFGCPGPAVPLQNDSHQPRQAARKGLIAPSLAPHLQHAWCCREPRKLIPFSQHHILPPGPFPCDIL